MAEARALQVGAPIVLGVCPGDGTGEMLRGLHGSAAHRQPWVFRLPRSRPAFSRGARGRSRNIAAPRSKRRRSRQPAHSGEHTSSEKAKRSSLGWSVAECRGRLGSCGLEHASKRGAYAGPTKTASTVADHKGARSEPVGPLRSIHV